MIDDDEVELVLERPQRLEEAVQLSPRRIDHGLTTHPPGEELEAVRPLHKRLTGGHLSLHHVTDVVRRRETEQKMGIGEARVEVDQEDPLTALSPEDRQVAREHALAGPALAAGDADHTSGAGPDRCPRTASWLGLRALA